MLTGVNDLKEMIIPDRNLRCCLMIWCIWIGTSSCFYGSALNYSLLSDCVLPAFLVSSGIWLVSAFTSWILKKKVLGMGDIKLIFVIFLYLGAEAGMYMLFAALMPAAVYACIITWSIIGQRGTGSITGKSGAIRPLIIRQENADQYFPFGTFLCLSTLFFLVHRYN